MSAGTEVERAEPPAQTPDIARPVISPAEAEVMVTELRQLIARILVENKHYQKIGKKDVLLKAGAEELGKFFGFSSQYEDLVVEQVEVENKGAMVKVWSASVKCSVLNREGRVLAESYGFYSGDERTDRQGKISPQPANTIVKMAQKRAYVGAILTATGTSELFTQDIEDAETAPVEPTDRMPSDDEKNAVCRLFAQKSGKGIEDAAAWMVTAGTKADSYNWLRNMAMALLLRADAAAPVTEDAVKTEPELPADPPPTEGDTEPETVDAEVVDEDDPPF